MKNPANSTIQQCHTVTLELQSGRKTIDCWVTVDFKEIALALAPKAYRNKSKQSRLRVGVIVEASAVHPIAGGL